VYTPLRFEALLADLSIRLSGLAVGHLDREIDRALEQVVAFLGTDRCTLLEMLPHGQGIVATHSFAKPGFRPAATPTHLAHGLRWYDEHLRKGETLRFDRLPDDLPIEARAERTYVATLPMRSHIAVPVLVDGRWACALLTATARRTHAWTDEEVDCVRIVGQIVAGAVRRRTLEHELQAREDRIDRLERQLEIAGEARRDADDRDPCFEEIAGQSPALRKVLTQTSQVAPTRASVLLLGETGTGKELLARAIHARSDRRDQPLISVNCAALPHSLVESELFGHEKGAFTGAIHANPGRFELADGGTIFLDEVAEIPLEAQAKLLRVLQNGELQRLGATRSRRVDVRVVAATNRNLEQAMTEGRFRRDLYYRLAVFPIEVPSLRERREDIPLLVWDFVQRRQDALGRRIERIPDHAMQRLLRYPWPGNVRELGNVIERALILSSGPELDLDSFLGVPRPDALDSERIADVERAHLLRVLTRCDWRINGSGNAADALGLNPSTLRSRLRKLAIRRPAAALANGPQLSK